MDGAPAVGDLDGVPVVAFVGDFDGLFVGTLDGFFVGVSVDRFVVIPVDVPLDALAIAGALVSSSVIAIAA